MQHYRHYLVSFVVRKLKTYALTGRYFATLSFTNSTIVSEIFAIDESSALPSSFMRSPCTLESFD